MGDYADLLYRLNTGKIGNQQFIEELKPTGSEASYQRGLGRMTTVDDVDDLQSLVPAKKERTELVAVPTKAAIASKAGTGVKQTATSNTTSGGIASPLNEQSRTFYAVRLLRDSSGVFAFEYENPQRISFLDADGRTVDIDFDDVAAGP